MVIARHAIAEYLDRDFDSFRWMKKLSERELLTEIGRLRNRPYFKTQPWLHQLVCFWIAIHHPRFLFLLDMGAGKTKIILDRMTYAKRERKLQRALVGVPRVINADSWVEAFGVHSDMEPWPCTIDDIEGKWDRLAYPEGDCSIIDYAGLHLAVSMKKKGKGKNKLVQDPKKMAHLKATYNFLALDESHKLRNHQNFWWSIINSLSAKMDFCYAMTGTLFGREVEDVWSQFRLVDQGETFGENLGLFRESFFTTKVSPWKGTELVFDRKMTRSLNKMLQHRSISYDERELVSLPKCSRIVQKFELTEEQREHYLRALEGLINVRGKIKELDANWLRMRQITSGYLNWKDESGEHLIHFEKNPKLELLEQNLENIGRGKFIICYDYTETGRMIVERCKKNGIGVEWLYGGTKDKSGVKHRFEHDDSIQGLVMNSEAGGTGNDGFQRVARYMFFYESPTPNNTKKQTIKRIHRPGQEWHSFVYDLVGRGTVDQGILDAIAADQDLYETVMAGDRAYKLKQLFNATA